MLIEENKPLAPLTTFGIGGPARWFVEAASEAEIVEAADWASSQAAPLFVLGGGSNLLVSDAGFKGLVLHVGMRGVALSDAPAQAGQPRHRIYEAAAGEDWDRFVERSVRDNCAGIECLAGIPGTVGGTPVQNVGAYGQEVAAVIERVRAFDLRERIFVEFCAAECGFAYRHSRFNSTDRARFVVTRVDFRLTPNGAPSVRYPDPQDALHRTETPDAQPSLAQVAAAIRRIRRSKGMLLVAGDPDCKSAGSFFKNPIVTGEQLIRIAAAGDRQPPRFPAGAGEESEGRFKVPAAWLIEQAGFAKGYALGSAGISSRHTLALVNRNDATAQEVLALAGQIAGAVQARFAVRLEMEPVMVGF